MSKPHTCMFCRYKKSRARDADACCVGAREAAPQVQARGMPERLRHPAPKPYPPPR